MKKLSYNYVKKRGSGNMNPLKILRNIMKKIVLLLMCFLAILNKTQAQYLNAQTYEFSIETIKSVSIANENNIQIFSTSKNQFEISGEIYALKSEI